MEGERVTMATYLLTWNPTGFDWKDLQLDVAEVRTKGWCPGRWSCGSTRRIRPGDRLFLMRLGQEPRGIIGSGTAVSSPYEYEHWDAESTSDTALYVDLRFDTLIDTESQPEAMLDWQTLRNEIPLPHRWTPQGSGVEIPPLEAARLEELWAARRRPLSPRRPDPALLVEGQEYRRRFLHEVFGGQWQGGISTPSQHNLILLFTGETGLQYGYEDGWTEYGVFLYSGEGQSGDMQFVRGNLAIRDHSEDGKDLHLFQSVRKGYCRYIGQMVCIGHYAQQGPDVDGHDRRVIVFELVPVGEFQEPAEVARSEQAPRRDETLHTLRERAIAYSTVGATRSERRALVHQRSAAIRDYANLRADGTCEACGASAPFSTAAGRPYLETHHIRRLSDGGPDDPEWIAAVCPNCHRRAHYAADAEAFNEQLGAVVHEKERALRA
jgi:5-methylcytosine-specific restriction protein A